jgi:hypothetical protein
MNICKFSCCVKLTELRACMHMRTKWRENKKINRYHNMHSVPFVMPSSPALQKKKFTHTRSAAPAEKNRKRILCLGCVDVDIDHAAMIWRWLHTHTHTQTKTKKNTLPITEVDGNRGPLLLGSEQGLGDAISVTTKRKIPTTIVGRQQHSGP